VIVGVGKDCPAPGPVTRDQAFQTEYSILVHWATPTGNDLPITGYALQMDDGLGGPFETVYDGHDNIQIREFEVAGLVAERFYRFRAYAIDVNGPGEFSEVTSIQACVPPDLLDQPEIRDVSKTEFTVHWNPPAYLGGCPITDYTLLRDEGHLDHTEQVASDVYIEVDPSTFESRPDMFQYTVVLDSSFTGKIINLKVRASNALGFTESRSMQITLASVPGKPFPAP
jgi:hypothetical protein